MVPLLDVQDLTVQVKETGQRIVDGVSFTVEPKSVVSLVGGSGSGKTTTGYAILRLLDPALDIERGKILFEGEDLSQKTDHQMNRVRGGKISMVFQEPLNAFNPVFSIGYQMDEMMRFHTRLDGKQRRAKSLKLLDLVGLPFPERVLRQYPHQLSGGMRQRAMIAQALAADPQLLIADEPTSNLDVTLQARIIDLFRTIKEELSLSILLITHDLGMVAHVSDTTIVLCEGRAVEQGSTKDIQEHPAHAYTKQLLEALKV